MDSLDSRPAASPGRGLPGRMLAVIGAALTVVACFDTASPAPPVTPPAVILSSGQCGVSYTLITKMTDSAALSYGAPAQTDTAQVCETWTGSDYQVQITQTGSSEPVSEYSEDVKTVVYSSGQTTPYAADGAAMESASGVGTTAFDFGQATAAEQQASYNDPYYGVTQGSTLAGCPGNPTAIVCDGTTPATAQQRSSGVPSVLREHNLRRRALRALMSDKDEIAPSAEGYRRFRSVAGEQETIIGIDPVTELIRTQDTNGPDGHTQAKLFWRLENGGYVRHRMEIDSDEVISGKTVRTSAVVSLANVLVTSGGR